MTGILAVQGAFAEHMRCLEKLGEKSCLIRCADDITSDIDRLVFPGGESTSQRKLIKETGMLETLKRLLDKNIPVLGTCAGMILLAESIEGGEESVFGALPVEVCRNGYGRQLGSFAALGNVGGIRDFPMRFIRAPFVKRVLSDGTEVLNVMDGRITAVKYKKRIGTAFHPELTGDLRIHEAFLSL